MDTKKTFWELITSYSIEVPTIQRDYTYGRERAKAISKKLIEKILNAIASQNPEYHLHLDFVSW